MSLGHKAAFAALRVLPVSVQGCADTSPVTPAAKALLWQGRRVTVGRNAACALAVEAPLISRCHAVALPLADGVWLADSSRHGTLVLELPAGSTIGNFITAEQLDKLQWEQGSMLSDQASVLLAAAHPTLVVLGLHRNDWLAGAKTSMSAELAAKGAVVLVYEQYGQLHREPKTGHPVTLEQPSVVVRALERLPFTRTPSKGVNELTLARNDKEQRHGRIREKYGDERLQVKEKPLAQVYNIFQLAAEVSEKRSRPLELQRQPKAKGATTKKRVRFSEVLEGGGTKAPAGKPAAGKSAAPRRQQAVGKPAAGKPAASKPVAGSSAKTAITPADQDQLLIINKSTAVNSAGSGTFKAAVAVAVADGSKALTSEGKRTTRAATSKQAATGTCKAERSKGKRGSATAPGQKAVAASTAVGSTAAAESKGRRSSITAAGTNAGARSGFKHQRVLRRMKK